MMAFETAWQLHQVLEIMLVIIHYIQQLRCVCVCFLCLKHYYLFAEVSIRCNSIYTIHNSAYSTYVCMCIIEHP